MVASKLIDMNAIADGHRKRNERLANVMMATTHSDITPKHALELLGDALMELAEQWRDEATAVMAANKKGCKGTADSLRDCATRVAGVAVAIQKHGLPEILEPAPLLASGSSTFGTGVNPSDPEGNPVSAFLADIGSQGATDLYAKLAVPEIDTQTLGEAAADIIAQVAERRAADAIDPHEVKVIKAATIHNVSLVSDPLPGLEVNLMVNDSFTIGAADPAPTWALQPDVPVYELTDLPMTWQAVPAHASVSQVQLIAECGLKYWLRYRRGATERPSWAMVGGWALHACIEEIESLGIQIYGPDLIKDMWRSRLEAAIMGTITANPLWPVETWHASKSGKEDRAWWDADGPEMVHRYLEWRAKWVAQGWELLRDAQGPIIEREFLIFLGGKPVKGFIDQAWYHPQRQQVAVIDAKSGSSAPPDYFQLAVYALAVAQMRAAIEQLGVTGHPTYVGGYWDARKGTLGPLVKLEERHPRAELEHRFATFNTMNSAGLYMPNTNSAYGGCNSCSLKRSCPIGSRLGAGMVSELGDLSAS